MNVEGIGVNEVVGTDPLTVMLRFSKFTNQQVVQVKADGFDQVEDMGINVLEEQDIKDLSNSLVRLLGIGGRVIFGIARTKRLTGMIHWIQDYERVSLEDAVITGTTQDEIRDIWSRVLERENARKTQLI